MNTTEEAQRLGDEAKARARNASTLPRDPEPRRVQLQEHGRCIGTP